MMVRMQVQFSELEKRGQAPHLSPSTDRAAAIGAGLARAYRVVSGRRRRGIGAI